MLTSCTPSSSDTCAIIWASSLRCGRTCVDQEPKEIELILKNLWQRPLVCECVEVLPGAVCYLALLLSVILVLSS